MTQEPLLAGFNNKHYDQFILKAVLSGFTPEEIKAVNDFIMRAGSTPLSVTAGFSSINMT